MTPSKHQKQLQLLLGCGFIYAFIFYLVPLFTQNEASKQVLEFVESRDIDSGALFYTESEEATQAEFFMRKGRASNKTPKAIDKD